MIDKYGILTKEESERIEKRSDNTTAITEKKFRKYRTRRKHPVKYHSEIGYDFLTYIRIVFFWACKKYEIRKKDIEILLFLYPQGKFTSQEFIKICRIHSMYPNGLLNKLLKDGFLQIWKENGKYATIYCLSDKARKMCAKMHNICASVEKISYHHNPLVGSEKSSDKYYLNLIYSLNKQNEERIALEKGKASE